MWSDASLETLEVGIPRKLEVEFWYATSTGSFGFGFCIMYLQIKSILTLHYLLLRPSDFSVRLYLVAEY